MAMTMSEPEKIWNLKDKDREENNVQVFASRREGRDGVFVLRLKRESETVTCKATRGVPNGTHQI